MTENEFRRLPEQARIAMPEDEVYAIILQTHATATETLTLEGWEFVAVNSERDDPTEVWKREIGGVVEWCEIFRHDTPLLLDPERCWLVAPYPIDPRLIED